MERPPSPPPPHSRFAVTPRCVAGNPLADAIGSLMIGGLLGGVASFIIYTNTVTLVGRSVHTSLSDNNTPTPSHWSGGQSTPHSLRFTPADSGHGPLTPRERSCPPPSKFLACVNFFEIGLWVPSQGVPPDLNPGTARDLVLFASVWKLLFIGSFCTARIHTSREAVVDLLTVD